MFTPEQKVIFSRFGIFCAYPSRDHGASAAHGTGLAVGGEGSRHHLGREKGSGGWGGKTLRTKRARVLLEAGKVRIFVEGVDEVEDPAGAITCCCKKINFLNPLGIGKQHDVGEKAPLDSLWI